MAIYDPHHDDMLAAQDVEILVRLKIREGADIIEVINEMDYKFDHVDILDTEIIDINTEF